MSFNPSLEVLTDAQRIEVVRCLAEVSILLLRFGLGPSGHFITQKKISFNPSLEVQPFFLQPRGCSPDFGFNPSLEVLL